MELEKYLERLIINEDNYRRYIIKVLEKHLKAMKLHKLL